MHFVMKDNRYSFRTFFDADTGLYIRSGILDPVSGVDTGEDPFQASFPHLIDVGVMGHCIHGSSGLCIEAGVQCYQSGQFMNLPNMSLEDFAWIARQCRGKCTQFALGGRGDPDQHEQFEELLRVSRENQIVPNFTTSGLGMTRDTAALCKTYCGAVAVSWYRSSYTLRAIQMLTEAGVTTNIHYVLSRSSIDEALARLRTDDFPQGINAVIFLLHKPVGQGSPQNILRLDDPRIREFFDLLQVRHPYRTGLDSCSAPEVVNFTDQIDLMSIDTCEGGRFSCYISSNLIMVPCSFDQQLRYGIQLNPLSIEDAWNSSRFEAFRNAMRGACPQCEKRKDCLGGWSPGAEHHPLPHSGAYCLAGRMANLRSHLYFRPIT